MPRVAVVILNWNRPADTLACVASVLGLAYGALHPVVVDNASTDDSVTSIRRVHPDLDLIQNADNLGYAEGNNVGIRHALEAGADYVLILNNDTLVSPDLVARLLRIIDTHPQIGIVGPKVLCTDPPDTLFAAGSFVQWRQGDLWHRGLFEPDSRYAHLDHPEPVEFIVGCGVLASRKLIKAIGLLDPEYYLNFEDVDWCIRAWRAGFEVWYDPGSVMWHKVSATLGIASPANTYYMTRNALRFFWRNAPTHLRWLAVSRILARTARTVAAWTLKPHYRTAVYRRKRDANLLAVRDFFLARYGAMDADVARVCYGDRTA